MRYAVTVLIALVAAPAVAKECYQSVADPAWSITINEGYGWVWRQGDRTIELPTGSAGSGIPHRIAYGPDGKLYPYLFHHDDLIVEMDVYAPVPCTGPASKVWADKACSNVLIAVEPDHRYFFQEVGKPVLGCLVASQHYAAATIFLTCDTGAEAQLLPQDDGTIRWNDIVMSAYDGPLPCGAKHGGE